MPRTSLPVVVGRLGRPGGRRLLLVGHVDVVPPGDLATWTTDPWAADVRDGRALRARRLRHEGRRRRDPRRAAGARRVRRRGPASTARSSPSRSRPRRTAARGCSPRSGPAATGDAAVITEPTGLDVVIAHAGAITFRLTVPGRAAHASVRREGVSALDNLYTLIRALEADEAARNAAETDPLMTVLGLPYPTIIGKVEGGDWASTVLDRVVVEGRYGVKLGQTWRDAEADLRACIDAACAADPFLRDHPVGLEMTGGKFSSSRVPADHPLPVSLAAAAEATLGRRPALLGEPYGADMRLLVNEGRDADGDLRAGRRAGRPQRRRARLARRGRRLRPGPRGVGRRGAPPAATSPRSAPAAARRCIQSGITTSAADRLAGHPVAGRAGRPSRASCRSTPARRPRAAR